MRHIQRDQTAGWTTTNRNEVEIRPANLSHLAKSAIKIQVEERNKWNAKFDRWHWYIRLKQTHYPRVREWEREKNQKWVTQSFFIFKSFILNMKKKTNSVQITSYMNITFYSVLILFVRMCLFFILWILFCLFKILSIFLEIRSIEEEKKKNEIKPPAQFCYNRIRFLSNRINKSN